jgi:magnesium-transporting ATPase (P-type)
MRDNLYSRRPLARWYWGGAIASLLFMALGCVTYLMHVTADPASLPLDQRAAFDAEPVWLTAAYAIAVWVGLAGTLMLLLRRKLAQPLMLVSLAAVVVWLAGLLLVPNLRETISSNDLAVAIAVAAITWTIFWFARHSAKRGWLR